jgi:hypothetical protein
VTKPERDFKAEIDRCKHPDDLRELLEAMDILVEQALQNPHESVAELRTTRELELLIRYGEYKLEQLLD